MDKHIYDEKNGLGYTLCMGIIICRIWNYLRTKKHITGSMEFSGKLISRSTEKRIIRC